MGSCPARPMSAGSRRISFAGASVEIEYEGDSARELVDFVCAEVDTDTSDSPGTTLRLTTTSPGQVCLSSDGKSMATGAADGHMAALLMDQVIERLARSAGSGLMFHAAAVARRGRGVMLPGQSGCGKTTLAAWLAGGCFDCLTDELVLLPPGEPLVAGLPRPLKVRRGSWTLLGPRTRGWPQQNEGLVTRDARLIHATALRPSNATGTVPLDLILFARYDTSGDNRFRELTSAQVGFRLMECLVNARNLAGHGFGEIARIARSVPAYEVGYSECGRVEGGIKKRLARLSASSPTTTE